MFRRVTNRDPVGGVNRTEGAIDPLLILYNANVMTVNPLQPRAQAIAILRDKILAVGKDAEKLSVAGCDTTRARQEKKVRTVGGIPSQ